MYSGKIKLIATDIDGTLLDSKKGISKRNEAALRQAHEMGITLVLASGRCHSCLPEVLSNLGIFSYSISTNGAVTRKLPDCAVTERLTIPQSGVERILYNTSDCRDHLECFVDGRPYCARSYWLDPLSYNAEPHSLDYIISTRHPVDDISAFIYGNIDSIEGMSVIVRNNREKAIMREKFADADDIYITTSVPRLLEFSNRLAGKGRALRRLVKLLGIGCDEVMAFGNEENDIQMLEDAGLGVLMENAPEELKRKSGADIIIAPSNDDDGVAYVIEKALGLNCKCKKYESS